MYLHVPEPRFKIFYIFVCKTLSSCRLKFPGKKLQTNIWKIWIKCLEKFKHSYCPNNLVVKSFAECSFSLQFTYFFRKAVLQKLFNIRFSYKQCNFSCGCLLVKRASKTVIRQPLSWEGILPTTVTHIIVIIIYNLVLENAKRVYLKRLSLSLFYNFGCLN